MLIFVQTTTSSGATFKSNIDFFFSFSLGNLGLILDPTFHTKVGVRDWKVISAQKTPAIQHSRNSRIK